MNQDLDNICPTGDARLAEIPTLKSGKHNSIDDGACLLEAVSWIAGEPFSDHPQCVCPVLGAFGRAWNDSLDDETRNRILAPFVPLLVGTKSTKAVAELRAWMAADWLIRTYAPAWLRLAGLADHADALTSADVIVDMAALAHIRPTIAAARAAARDAARDAARATAWATAWDAAWDAVWDAVWDAAQAAVWDAARDAARDAAQDALAPTVAELQASAVDLFERMIGVTE
jgi:hypothetical protein